MAAVWVVPALDVLEDGEPRGGLRLEALAVEQLALERGEEALAHGVVVRVAHGAHRRAHAHRVAATAEGERRVLQP